MTTRQKPAARVLDAENGHAQDAMVATALTAIVGGKVGERYHRKVDRAGL